jgi:hypothetical protein
MPAPFRRTLSTVLALAALAHAAGCGSSATTSTATSPSGINRCAVTVNGNGQVPAQGGAGSLAVTAARECTWSAAVEGPWLTIKAGANGQGDGAVEFNAVANPDPAIRRGAIVLNEQRVEVTQAAAECAYSLSEGAGSFPQAGGSGQFEVRASSGLCSWSAQSDASWVSIRAGASSKGTTTVQFEVAATTGPARTATITAAGLQYSISQSASAAGCTYSVSPGSFSAAAGGDTLTVRVTTGASCAWTAASAASWIALSSAASATGPGAATFSIAASSASRSGSVVVGGQTVAVSQGGAAPPPPCTFSISPDSAPVAAAGGGGKVTVAAAAGCAWSASSNAPSWLTITAGTSGSGGGEVSYQAAATTAARSGTLTIAGKTFTVNQQATAVTCSFSIAPEQQNVDADSAELTVGVTTTGGCQWNASSNAPWIKVRDDRGTGPDQVRITIEDNKGPARSGTATIAGRTFTVNQAEKACSYKVSPRDLKVDQDGRFARIDIEAAAGCSWTATSNVQWIRVFNTSGSGDDQVWLFVSDNDEGKPRDGTVTVAGQTVTVSQKKK